MDAAITETKKMLITSLEAARLLSISMRTLWGLTQSREIRCVRIGRSVRYYPTELQRYVEARLDANG